MYTSNSTTQPGQGVVAATNKAVAIIGSLILGTGTAYWADRIETWQGSLRHRVGFSIGETPASPAVSRADVRTAAEHIENIRKVLNPSVADLASIFDVSRQAIYKWLSADSTPENDKLVKITELSQIADGIGSAGTGRTHSLLKLKAFNGQSLMDLIRAGKNKQEHVAALIQEAETMDAAYRMSGLSSSKAPQTSDWQASISIPASSDRS